MLPFGASISCVIWEKDCNLTHWIIQSKSRNPSILHYFNDFLFASSPNSNLCQFTLDLFKQICNHIGVPIALDKTTVPNTTITFLDIGFSTIYNNYGHALPPDKLHILRQTIRFVQNAEKVTLKSLQSLIGLLNFTCKTVAPGGAFCRRLIDATIGIKKPHRFIRANKGMRDYLAMWQQFLDQYNGVTVIDQFRHMDLRQQSSVVQSQGGTLRGFGIFSGRLAHNLWLPH